MPDFTNPNELTPSAGGVVYPSQQEPPKHPFYKSSKLWTIIVVFLLLVVMALTTLLFLTPQNSITIANQQIKDTISVKQITLTKGGFLVFKSPNRYNKPGGTIASTEYLLPDTYSDFTVDVYSGLLLTPENPPVKPGNFVFATLFEDTDGSKSLGQNDKPLKDWLGRPVSVRFRAK